jgi:hypothetical protein
VRLARTNRIEEKWRRNVNLIEEKRKEDGFGDESNVEDTRV